MGLELRSLMQSEHEDPKVMEKVVAPLCVMSLGLCFSLWGAVSVKLMPRLSIDKGRFGTLISLFMGSCLLLSLVMGVVLDSVGYMPVAVFGFAMTSFCLFLLANFIQTSYQPKCTNCK